MKAKTKVIAKGKDPDWRDLLIDSERFFEKPHENVYICYLAILVAKTF